MVWGKALAQCGLVLLSLWLCIQSLPVVKQTKSTTNTDVEFLLQDVGLHYQRYLREVMDYLEKDPHFREKLRSAKMGEINEGQLSKELDFVHHSVRTKLDELKREEMNRLRMIIKAKIEAERDKDGKVDHRALVKASEYINHMNPEKFEVEDLDRLLKTTLESLQNFDIAHHAEFKRYEMMKEHERRERLKNMNEEDRKKAEQEYEQKKKKRAEHPKINHPGSEDQLKEVWKNEDGLDPEDFNPKTFFKLHDTNEDGFLDGNEIEAMFTKELEKAYTTDDPETDMADLEEERILMREHVMKEMDTNKDRLLSLSEFMASALKEEFKKNEDWEIIDDKPVYTEEELRNFELKLAEQHNSISEKSAELQKQREELERKQEELNVQRETIQQTMEKLKAQTKKDEVKREGEPAPVVPGNSQPLPPSHQQQDVPVPGHS